VHEPGPAQREHLPRRQPEAAACLFGQLRDGHGMTQGERRLQVHEIGDGRQRAFRERLLAGVIGDVLEIGGGTGANLPCYGPGVVSLTLTEPQPSMLRRLERAVQAHRLDARVLRAPAEDLAFNDDSFDVAVSTLVLCGVDDQPRALRELRRVLRPGGRLLLIEHLRPEDPAVARLQARMNWLNRLVVCCDCNRPTLDRVREAGFTVDHLEHTALPRSLSSWPRPS
jgi:SAM-dependent methyltransferase